MRYIVLILLSITLCSNECNLYRGKMYSVKDSADRYPVYKDDKLQLRFVSSDFFLSGKTFDNMIYFESDKIIDSGAFMRDYHFSIVSSSGVHMKQEVFFPSREAKKTLNMFAFRADNNWKNRQYTRALHKDSFYLIHSGTISIDTVFRVVYKYPKKK